MITIISATNRKNSVSREITDLYKSMLEGLGQKVDIIDLAELPADFTETALYENAGKHTEFNRLRNKMVQGKKFVFIVPEYNGSFPGVLKAFIDGLQFPETFTGKKCALVGVSSGVQGAGLAMSHLTDIFNYCGTNVLALKVKLAGIDDAFENGAITNELYKELLDLQVQQFIDF